MDLHKVTLTGADDKTSFTQLIKLSRQYPWAEWGILASVTARGQKPRYPSLEWISELVTAKKDTITHCPLSLHLCGKLARKMLLGDWSLFARDYKDFIPYFDRMQINFNRNYEIDYTEFALKWRQHCPGTPIIFQAGAGRQDHTAHFLDRGYLALSVFDLSGGTGVYPETWKPLPGPYAGYAGGIGPDNVVETLQQLESVVGDQKVWIDMESKIRDESDCFDFDKVSQVLKNVANSAEEIV